MSYSELPLEKENIELYSVEQSYPLVSVTIPTYNSEEVIGECLSSVKAQTYSNIELIVVDSQSEDRTTSIATQYGARVIQYEGRLLGARYQGVLHAAGEFVLLLDSDQILERTCVERAVSHMYRYDMLVFEELSYHPCSWLQKLFQADRKLIHTYLDEDNLDPIEGTLLPRFFRRELLLQAFKSIPRELIPKVIHHDHAIIYFEAYNISKRVGILKDAVYHREPHNLSKAWKTNFRYGASLKELQGIERYRELLKRRDKRLIRRGAFRHFLLGSRSTLLLIILKAAQVAGYLFGNDNFALFRQLVKEGR